MFRHWTRIEIRDYVNLLHLDEGYRVKELKVNTECWLAGKPLKALKLTDEGVSVLGIKRHNGHFVGAPTKDTKIKGNDLLIIYGRQETLDNLERRRAEWEGDRGHHEAISKQQEVLEKQERKERESEAKKEKRKRQKEAEER
jgi:uncharacterized protein with PhoU and TrkA domain